jgi:hypothetical protein
MTLSASSSPDVHAATAKPNNYGGTADMHILKRELTRATYRRAVAALAGAAALVICALAVPALAASSSWHGALDKDHTTTLSFNYSGSRITKFTIPYIPCSSGLNGVQTEEIFVPSIPVSGGRFSITYHVSKKNPQAIIKISGTLRGSRASGTVHGQGVCDTDPQPFHANLGAFKTVAAAKPKTGACTMTGCLASNGIFIKVTAVDRTIKGVASKTGSITIPADPAYQNGGVGVTITETDRSANGPVLVDPAGNFQLRLGSGVLSPGGGPDPGPAVNGSGANYTCAQVGLDNPLYEKTLTRGASFGPKSVCFGAPTAASRQHLTLYYMPGGTVLAKIPLG